MKTVFILSHALILSTLFVAGCAPKPSPTQIPPVSSTPERKSTDNPPNSADSLSHSNSMSDETKTIEEEFPEQMSRISTKGTTYFAEVAKNNWAPRGSAIYQSSGSLEDKNITAIIQAMPGHSMTNDPNLKPSIEGVNLSIQNSLILALRKNHKKVAIPFIGGDIFLNRIGIKKEELAEKIILSALLHRKTLRIRFVIFSSHEAQLFQDTLNLIRQEPPFADLTDEDVSVIEGDIFDFHTHGCTAIVNAGRMEATFGGGLSGKIGSATKLEEVIDFSTLQTMRRFNCKVLKRLGSEIDCDAATSPSSIQAFYQGTGTNSSGFYFDDILNFDYAHLEKMHDFIQWIFPTDQPSLNVAGSPILTEEDQIEFQKSPELQKAVIASFKKMLNFYGLIYKNSRIEKGSNFNQRNVWISDPSRQHNFARISRMIRSLRLLGLQNYAEQFYQFLNTDLIADYPRLTIAIDFWKKNATDPLN